MPVTLCNNPEPPKRSLKKNSNKNTVHMELHKKPEVNNNHLHIELQHVKTQLESLKEAKRTVELQNSQLLEQLSSKAPVEQHHALKAEIALLQHANKSHMKKHKAWKEDLDNVESLKKEVHAKSKKHEALEKELRDLKAAHAELKESLKKSDGKSLQKRLETANSEYDKMLSKHNTLCAQHEKLAETVEQVSTKHRALSTEHKDLSQRYQSLKKELNDAKHDQRIAADMFTFLANDVRIKSDKVLSSQLLKIADEFRG